MRCSDASSPFPLRFVSFARRYRTRRNGGLSLAEATGPPRFLGNPCVHALVSDPDRSDAPSPSPLAAFQRVDVAFHHFDGLGIL